LLGVVFLQQCAHLRLKKSSSLFLVSTGGVTSMMMMK
jgi:hypothetical protein